MRIPLLLLPWGLLLTGCMTVLSWSKPGATNEQFLQDRYVCVRDARGEAGGFFVSRGTGGGEVSPVVSRDVFVACMASRGWKQDPNGFMAPKDGIVRLE